MVHLEQAWILEALDSGRIFCIMGPMPAHLIGQLHMCNDSSLTRPIEFDNPQRPIGPPVLKLKARKLGCLVARFRVLLLPCQPQESLQLFGAASALKSWTA